MGLFQITSSFFIFFLIQSHIPQSHQQMDKIFPGFQASQSDFNSTNGLFLFSNSSIFALGFYTGVDSNLFSLGIIHILSSRIVWTANTDSMVKKYSLFVFDKTGNVFLEGSDENENENENRITIWSTETKGKDVVSMELMDSGNLVLQSENGSLVWQSFHYPTNTLLPGQVFWEGMSLRSYPNNNNLSNYLNFKQGDMVLSAGFKNPQIYWSLSGDDRTIKNGVGGEGYVLFGILETNSWNFYDQKGNLMWQFMFYWKSDWKDKWVAVLNTDGTITFHNLEFGKAAPPELVRIPTGNCGVPESCDPYFVCFSDNRCYCPPILKGKNNSCKKKFLDDESNQIINNSIPCNQTSIKFLFLGENLDYFALSSSSPSMNSNLTSCKSSCEGNCSCFVMFFEPASGNCYFFDEIGSLRRSEKVSGGFISYMKIKVPGNTNSDSDGDGDGALSPNVPMNQYTNRKKHITIMSMILAGIAFTFMGLFLLFFYRRRMKEMLNSIEETNNSEEDKFLEKISGVPIRFGFGQLRRATKNFSTKIGHGGFGSVYSGGLKDGTRLAVKKLERNGQGMREFRAEVSLIGNTHHVNLVKLKGYCYESHHRLLVYEYLSNGSLDKWIFIKNDDDDDEGQVLDWDTRFNIALGTAKAIAYLHEECEAKIIHCDIKPENILLDENFTAKVSDFGMAKLMTKEQTFICTQLRGTRGYVAPEWITNLSISDKSDVFSYGMVLLEIIGGRKNYDSNQTIPEMKHFPSYAFKKLEEKKVREIVDRKMEVKEDDKRVEIAIEVALWCIQEDVNLRPSMRKVVQMLEGVCEIPCLRDLSQMGGGSSFSWSSGVGTMLLGLNHGCNFSEVLRLSDVCLSGPR